MKTAPFQQLFSLEAPPSPLSSRPERSVVERSAVLVPWTLLRATTALPFVISTGAQRSGEICGFFSLSSGRIVRYVPILLFAHSGAHSCIIIVGTNGSRGCHSPFAGAA